jgi:hypothetical protein
MNHDVKVTTTARMMTVGMGMRIGCDRDKGVSYGGEIMLFWHKKSHPKRRLFVKEK